MFVTMFEAAHMSNDIPQAQCKGKLHYHITLKAKVKIQFTIQDYDSTYEDIKEALKGCRDMTFCSAAEYMFSGEKGRLFNLDHRQCDNKLARLIAKVTKSAETTQDCVDCMTVALLRYNLVSSLSHMWIW